MKPETTLDSVVFQLTPTRTRCDLVIIANGKTEKVASGLLNPFLAHLKAAQDQIAKGGYSITLQPNTQTNAAWFTKATVERFVRFVHSPEILERVNTIESEILQIEEAILIQGKEGLREGNDEDHQVRPVNHTGARSTVPLIGSKSLDADSEKAIVIYKPGGSSPETNGTAVPEESSKVQLLRVLETRKNVLQKEQGMAFARAVAAGFDMNQMSFLMAFAESFGAARLLLACTKFVALWRQKHESGQWVEIEAAEAMRSDFFPVNASGIVFSGDDIQPNEAWPGSMADGNTETSGKACSSTDTSMNPRQSSAQGRFQHPMFAQWPAHAPPGASGFQPYPIHAMPYYGPFYPSYSQMEDLRFNSYHRRKAKSHSLNSEGNDVDSETEEEEVTQSSEGRIMTDQEGIARQGSSRKLHKPGKKQSDVVVIRNINYIAPKGQHASENESDSASQSKSDEESVDSQFTNIQKNKKSSKYSKGRKEHSQTVGTSQTSNKEDDSGNWEVFQSFLLRNEENNHVMGDQSMLSGEKVHTPRKKLRNTAADPLFPPGRNSYNASERNIMELDMVNGRTLQRNRHLVSNYELNSSGEGSIHGSSSTIKLQEMEGRSGYRRGSSDDFITFRREKHLNANGSVDFYAENERRLTCDSEISSHSQVNDEFIVSCRSTSQEQPGRNTNAVDAESELPSVQGSRYLDAKVKNPVSYEPHDLSLMPKRDREREHNSYDPVIDHGIKEHAGKKVPSGNNIKDKDIKTKQGVKRTDKDKSSTSSQNPWDKRKVDPVRRGKPSKLNPLAEAQARAEKLRAFKADLLKAKKEKEQEELKRLEALKRERQKRIAARSDRSSSTPIATRTQVPSKVSLTVGSKFRDSSPAFSSPLQRFPIRRSSLGSNDTQKIRKVGLTSAKQNAGNGLVKSASSGPELKKESNNILYDRKTVRRLSEPKGRIARRSSSVKSSRDLQISKRSSLGSSDALQDSSLKFKGSVLGLNKRVFDGSQNSKISAIMNLDRSKSATLPELRTKSTCNSQTMPFNLVRKDTVSTESETKMPMQSNSKGKKIVNSCTEVTDDSLVIEKSVVTLEKDIFPGYVKPSEEKIHQNDFLNHKSNDRNVVSEYPMVHAPPSPVTFDGAMKDTNEIKAHRKPISYEAKTIDPEKSIFIPSEKAYQALHARATSLDDTEAINLNHIRNLHINGSDTSETSLHVSPICLNNPNPSLAVDSPEVFERSGKESTKGFKRLLKFARKNHNPTSSEGSIEPEGSSLNNQKVATEVATLKALISENDSSSGSIPKPSRSFSIFSPFRTKSSEKKLSM